MFVKLYVLLFALSDSCNSIAFSQRVSDNVIREETISSQHFSSSIFSNCDYTCSTFIYNGRGR